MTTTKLRVGVIYGGKSGEHEVSVASAASIIKHLDRKKYDPVPVHIAYFTAVTDATGHVTFLKDPYGYDVRQRGAF